jgi:hypothetical protein
LRDAVVGIPVGIVGDRAGIRRKTFPQNTVAGQKKAPMMGGILGGLRLRSRRQESVDIRPLGNIAMSNSV